MDNVKFDPESFDEFVKTFMANKLEARLANYIAEGAKLNESTDALQRLTSGTRWAEMGIGDQLEFFKKLNEVGELCKKLIEKYEFK